MMIQEKKQLDRDKCSALVPIEERMIAGEPISVSGCTCSNVGLAIGSKVLRPREGRFEQSLVAQTRASPMRCELFFMNSADDGCVDPDKVHYFANSRNTLRRRFMTARAAVICSSKTGS